MSDHSSRALQHMPSLEILRLETASDLQFGDHACIALLIAS
jgi:hypothetical protein